MVEILETIAYILAAIDILLMISVGVLYFIEIRK